jgi:hypothetical protein
LFVSSLYHILSHLSRVFFFGYRLSSDELGMGLTTTEEKSLGYPRHISRGSIIGELASPPRLGFCSRHIRNIVSACAVWFTFIYRKPTHLAVGSSGRGLTDSRGSAVLSVALPSPFVPLLYHTLRGLSRGFFEDFCLPLSTWFLFPSPLDTLIVTQLGWFVKRKFQRVPGFLLFPCQFPRTGV